MEKDELIKDIITNVKGEFGLDKDNFEMSAMAFEMGEKYKNTKGFENSKYYRQYKYYLEDGERVVASSFLNIFTTRMQTKAYMDSETILISYFPEKKEDIFQIVRSQRFGINGVFRAVMSSKERQNIVYDDYVMVIVSFCAGYYN